VRSVKESDMLVGVHGPNVDDWSPAAFDRLRQLGAEVVGTLWTNGTKGQVTSGGFLTDVIEHWVLIPENPHRVAVWGYLLLIACIVVLVQLKGWWRIMVLVPTLTLTAFVWENLLIVNPAVTRSVLFGVLLIAVMTVRPEGLFGQAKVEVV